MALKFFSIALFLMLCFVNLLAEDENDFKVGKMDEEQFAKYGICPIDSNANAYVIADFGKTYFTYSQDRGFEMQYIRKVRIKILKNSAFEFATFKEWLYEGRTSEEVVSSVKGFTYNLENGKIVKSKLTKESQFKERVSDSRLNYKITMPNVKEGSIVDLEYCITSEYIWNIRGWQFQEEIPVLYSEYKLSSPEYFVFKNFENGFINLNQQHDQRTEKQTFTERGEVQDDGRRKIYTSTLEYRENINTISASKIEAFVNEPFLSSSRNYISSVDFELERVAWPNQPVKSFTKNWESINKELLDDDEFGGRLNWTGFAEDTVDAITANCNRKLEKANKIYSYVKKQMKWDDRYGIWAKKSLKDVYKDGSGSSSEINLLLTAMLRKSGLQADPVIISTRDNGIVLMEYPVLDKFNYVICYLNIDGTNYTLDATDKYCPFGMLPYRCLNGQGRLIHKTASATIDLKPVANKSTTNIIQAKVNENKELECTIQTIRKGYAALNFRNDLSEAKSIDDFIKKYQDSKAGLSIGKYNFKGIDSLSQPVITDFTDVVMTNKCDVAGDIISINPMLYERLDENPFKLETRKYPVDYGYNIDDSYIIAIQIPEGYQLDEMPKPLNMALPENGGKFTFNCIVNNDKIQILRKFQISKTMFTDANYSFLKEFYAKMVEKEAEMLVFKKISTTVQSSK